LENAATLLAAEEAATAVAAAEANRASSEAVDAKNKAQEAATTADAEKLRQEAAAAAAATRAKVEAAAAAAAAKGKGKKGNRAQKDKATGGNPSSTTTIAQQAQNTELPQDLDDGELSEGGLPEGSNLSGCKALLDDYPKHEANSKQTKRTNTGKGKKGNPTPKA
jgi:hypothetical protein